jgi:hypothetical protein
MTDWIRGIKPTLEQAREAYLATVLASGAGNGYTSDQRTEFFTALSAQVTDTEAFTAGMSPAMFKQYQRELETIMKRDHETK